MTAETCKTTLLSPKPFVPIGKIVSLLTTDAPQARRLYYHPEYNFQTVNNPNAGGLWLEPWQPGGRRETFAQDKFAELYKEEAKL